MLYYLHVSPKIAWLPAASAWTIVFKAARPQGVNTRVLLLVQRSPIPRFLRTGDSSKLHNRGGQPWSPDARPRPTASDACVVSHASDSRARRRPQALQSSDIELIERRW